jgi:hypothetical protein
MRGNKHDYLEMTQDYSLPTVLRVDITKYVKSMIDYFPDFYAQINCSQLI